MSYTQWCDMSLETEIIVLNIWGQDDLTAYSPVRQRGSYLRPGPPHIKLVSRTAFFHVHNVAKIRSLLLKNWSMPLLILDWTTASHYCQDVQIIPFIVCRWSRTWTLEPELSKMDLISPVLASLPWLPVKIRIDCKILLITRVQVCSKFLEFRKLDWEDEPLAIRQHY